MMSTEYYVESQNPGWLPIFPGIQLAGCITLSARSSEFSGFGNTSHPTRWRLRWEINDMFTDSCMTQSVRFSRSLSIKL